MLTIKEYMVVKILYVTNVIYVIYVTNANSCQLFLLHILRTLASNKLPEDVCLNINILVELENYFHARSIYKMS